ncbi:MAG: hypothetical protein KGN39_04420 [Betaproteobacteria bacterium]|nr:hypothetical protein [Betaproteobacteria bacterium]
MIVMAITPTRQRGFTLFVGLIILLLMTLLALAAIRMATTNVQTIGNEQFRNEADAASNLVLDQVVNDSNFVADYAAAPPVSANVGQGTYVVVVAKPSCKRFRVIPVGELVTKVNGQDTITTANIPCIQGQGSSPLTIAGGTSATTSSASLCAKTLWDVQAQVTSDAITGASSTVNQGIETQMAITDTLNSCQ